MIAGAWGVWVLARARPAVPLWIPVSASWLASGFLVAWCCWKLPFAVYQAVEPEAGTVWPEQLGVASAHPLEHADDPAAGSLHGPALAAEFGLNGPLPPLLLTALPHTGYQPAAYRVQPATVTRALADGDIVDLGDRTLTVLHLPGHSPGSIALFDPADGTLFSGDVIYDGGLLDSLPGSDPEEYARSLRRLRNLPVRVTRAGHGPSFDQDRLHRLIDNYLQA